MSITCYVDQLLRYHADDLGARTAFEMAAEDKAEWIEDELKAGRRVFDGAKWHDGNDVVSGFLATKMGSSLADAYEDATTDDQRQLINAKYVAALDEYYGTYAYQIAPAVIGADAA